VQLTRDGVVHMAFHPRCDTLVLAAADKGGHVGLWHIDRDSCGDAAWAPPAAAAAPVKPSPGRRRSAGARGLLCPGVQRLLLLGTACHVTRDSVFLALTSTAANKPCL